MVVHHTLDISVTCWKDSKLIREFMEAWWCILSQNASKLAVFLASAWRLQRTQEVLLLHVKDHYAKSHILSTLCFTRIWISPEYFWQPPVLLLQHYEDGKWFVRSSTAIFSATLEIFERPSMFFYSLFKLFNVFQRNDLRCFQCILATHGRRCMAKHTGILNDHRKSLLRYEPHLTQSNITRANTGKIMEARTTILVV